MTIPVVRPGGPRLHRSLLLDDRFHGLGRPLRGLVSSLRLGGHGIRRERTCVTASGTTRATEVAARLNAGIAQRVVSASVIELS